MTAPYYDDGTVTLYHGDCLALADVWNLPGAVLVTDPPYGMSYVSNSAKAGPSEAIAADDSTALRDAVLDIWGADRPALVFGTWRVPRPAGVVQLIVWDKGNSPGMGDLTMPWGPAHEDVYVFGSGFVGKRRPNVVRVATLPPSSSHRPGHPTPKPIGLMTDLIRHCPPDAVIVDPFAGSGSTLVAARDLGRRAIGVELKADYCDMIADRLGNTLDFGAA